MATRRKTGWIAIALHFEERNKSRTSILASELLLVSQGTGISRKGAQAK